MARYINIADTKGRNAEIIISGKTKKPLVKQLDAKGKPVSSVRVLKGTAENTFEGLMLTYGNPEAVAQAIIKGDPEINLKMTGAFIQGSSRVYVGADLKPASRVSKKEVVHNPDGSVKEERIPKELMSNVLSELPVRPGKLFPKKDIYNKIVLSRKYQLKHINGLTFDFLFEMAKELYEKESVMLIGAGAKGNEPLVFQDDGKAYRAFLEGRIKDGKYLLIMHLSNLELKSN
jgi:hypothetical protein